MYKYEREDARESDLVLYTSDASKQKARSIFCGDYYINDYGGDAKSSCILDDHSAVVTECVEPKDIVNRTTYVKKRPLHTSSLDSVPYFARFVRMAHLVGELTVLYEFFPLVWI